MGRISADQPQNQQTQTTTHFSHPHPLKLINYIPQQTQGVPPSCSGCKLIPSGLIYSCATCPYFLHKKCFEMPKSITHPCHKDHPFTLFPQPAYGPNTSFRCDACGEEGNGFSYHCKPCGVDLHILCAVMPLSLTHTSHQHKLTLTYECPYLTKTFGCDICKRDGSNHWLYRCSSCGFDAHLNCARTHVQPPPLHQNNANFAGFQPHGPAGTTTHRSAPQPQPQPQQGGFGPQFAPTATPYAHAYAHPMQQQPMMPNPPAVGIPAAAGGQLNPPQFGINNNRQHETTMFLQALQQMIGNNNHAAMQAVMAGGAAGLGGGLGAGGFGGGNNSMREYQQLMHLFSSLNNGGIGGGGGGIPGLNGLGGGGFDLQSLMNGGFGGGGIDLQSLLGGGNGLDLLGGGGLGNILGGLGGFGLF